MADSPIPNGDSDSAPLSPDSRERRVRVLEGIARKFEQTVKIQRALFEIASFANTQADLREFYRRVHDVLKDLTSAENLFIALLDEEAGRVTFPYYIEGEITDHPYEYMDLDTVKHRAITSLIIETRELVHVNREEFYSLKISRGLDPDVGEIPEDWLGVPLMQGDKLLGALVIQSFAEGFRYSPQDESMMRQISQHVANALQRKHFTDSLTEAKEKLEANNQHLQSLLDERQEIHQKLKHNANHDALTGLPNRALLLKRLRRVIHRSTTTSMQDYAVLFLDLDRFKIVNDSLGHLVGDALLVEVGCRLRHCVRPEDLVSRLGGDEFCVLLTSEATPEIVHLVAQRILEHLRKPMFLNSQRVVTSTSIGIAFGHQRYETAEDVLRDADTALYEAKSTGKSKFRIFDQSMRADAISRLQMEQALRQAVEDNEITVCYQPIVDLQTGHLVSFEALARWNHPVLGNVPASRFIPIAEEIHLISQLTLSVLRQAINQISQWRAEIFGLQDLSLNVNVSSLQIESTDFVESIKNVLSRAGLPSRNLKLEVTESMLLNNAETAAEVLNQLHSMNVRLALDDFGTGYSSLSCLNSLPLDELKIDLSFVRNIVQDARSHAIVQMIVALAQVMGLQVVAEGVEDIAQMHILRDLGVDCAQGYLFGEPTSATSITRQLCQSKPGGDSSTDTVPYSPVKSS